MMLACILDLAEFNPDAAAQSLLVCVALAGLYFAIKESMER